MVLGIGTVGSYELVFKDKINTTDVLLQADINSIGNTKMT
uniref:Uncharacterized protein n=1 Tax=Bacillus thuringiensis serovar chinensis CT-43 TaxID=541229 RepID=E7CGL8_BACTU|nr:hypothetical protein pBMB0558_00475 [Bacillus thuringiensis serovar chinensis CT-43]